MLRRALIFVLLMLSLPVQGLASLSGKPMVEGTPTDLECASAILVEIESGQIIFEQHADDMRPVASVTKLMTILLALEAVDSGRASMDDVVTVSKNASGMGGSQILLDTGEQQTYAQLLKSVIVCSANDSAVALAEYLYGSEELFVEYMNERAEELGMTNTKYVNCTGLPAEGQYTTARDVARLSMETFGHDEYYRFSKTWLEDFDHGDGRITQMTNTNKLTRLYEGCDGGKTGSTDEAGFCFSATAKRGGMRLIAVTLGSKSSTARFDSAAAMFDYGFANYRLYPVAEKGTPVKDTMPVTGGDKDDIQLALDDAFTILVMKGSEQNVELTPELPDSLAAPVEKGAKVGKVNVVIDGRLMASLDVVAAESVKATGIKYTLDRILDLWVI